MPRARDRWKPLVDALEASSLSVAEFAGRAGVNRNTLAWWRSALRKEATHQRPVPVTTTVTELAVVPLRAPGRPVRLHLGHRGAHVDVDRDTDLDLLRDVLDALC